MQCAGALGLALAGQLPKRCSGSDPGLSQGAQRDSLVEHIEVGLLNGTQEVSIHRRHDQSGTLSPAFICRKKAQRPVVALMGPVCEGCERLKKGARGGQAQHLTPFDANLLEQGIWQVDTPAARILANVSQNIGVLQGRPELSGIAQGLGLRGLKDPSRQAADCACHAVTVSIECSPVLQVHRVEVLLNTLEDCV